MKVVITGGAGHVGRAIRRQLATLGWETVDVSRSGTVRADLASPDFTERVTTAVRSCDAIVHCAASMATDLTERLVSLVNGAGTQEVIRMASLTGASRLVFISSVPVIGQPLHLPISEDHPANPLTAYHASKLFGEHLIRLAGSQSLRTTSLRLTSPIGPGTPPGRIFSEFASRARRGEPLILAGMGGRQQNYVDVRDVARAIGQCLQSEATGIFNIAGSAPASNLELAQCCCKVLESPSPILFSGSVDPQENLTWDVSIEKAHRSFGYQPVFSLEESIRAFASAHESGHHQ